MEAGIEEFETYEDFKSQKLHQKVQVSNKNPSLFDVKNRYNLRGFSNNVSDADALPLHIRNDRCVRL